jgi:hypothetical protein
MEITFKDYLLNPNRAGIANWKINGLCTNCQNSFSMTQVKSLRKRSFNLLELCNRCYLNYRCYSNPEWLLKNKKAQLISQNKPEQKLKNAIGVSASWTKERRKKFSDLLTNRWKNCSEEERERMLKPLRWTDTKDSYYETAFKKSVKGISGEYNGISYQSLLELSFLLTCEERGVTVARYESEGIEYLDEKNKKRLYYPDFIIYGKVIIEIKGHIFGGQSGEKIIYLKTEAAKKFCQSRGLKYRIFHRSHFLRNKLHLAKNIHENS